MSKFKRAAEPADPDAAEQSPADAAGKRQRVRSAKEPKAPKQPKEAPVAGDKQRRSGKVRRPAPEVPFTSFNFVEDYWAERNKLRQRNLISTLVAVVVIAAVGAVSLLAQADISQLESRRDTLQSEQVRIREETTALTGGIANLPEHLRQRRTEVLTALGHDVDAAALATNIRAAIPATIDVSSITVTEVPVAAPAPAGTPAEGGEAEAAATTTTTTTVAPQDDSLPPVQVTYTLSIVAHGSSFQDVRTVLDAVSAIPGVTNILPANDGTAETGITITLTATLDPAVVQSRRYAAAQDLDASRQETQP